MNRTLQKIICGLLSLLTVFSVLLVPVNASSSSKKIWDSNQIYNEGYTPLTTQQFLSGIRNFNDAIELITGMRILPEETFEIVVNDNLNDIFGGIKEASGGVLDCDALIHNLPSLADSSKKFKSLFKIDMAVVEPPLQKVIDNYYREGNLLMGFAASLLKAYLKTMEKCELYSVPVKNEIGKFEIRFTLVFEDGTKQDSATGIIYDSVNKTLNSKDNTGVLGTGFILDTDNYIIQTSVNSWQRQFGFTMAYDIFCYVTKIFDYTTVRVKFNYDNREWMIQLWKGRYLIAPGGEIGIYNRDMGAPGTYYNCAGDEDMMLMSMELYHLDKLLFKMKPQRHWWLTGFKIHSKAYLPESLTMKGTIDFPTKEMADLFVKAASDTGVIQLVQNKAHVSFVW